MGSRDNLNVSEKRKVSFLFRDSNSGSFSPHPSCYNDYAAPGSKKFYEGSFVSS